MAVETGRGDGAVRRHEIGMVYGYAFCAACGASGVYTDALAVSECPGPAPTAPLPEPARPIEPERATSLLDGAIRRGFRSPFDPPERP